MPGGVRVIDTGLRSGRENIAHDQAMVELHAAGEIPDSFKFIQFKPCALIGRHQALSQELNLDACKAQGVETVRRMTGGGAIYMDGGQLGWGLVCDRRTIGGSLTDVTRKICEALAAGLSTLGIEARFRPRNDIEVDGKKISGTGGFFDGNTLIFQGTVLIEIDAKKMMSVLNVPLHKLEKRGAESAEDRVTSLTALLGYRPTMEAVQSAMLKGLEEHLGLHIEWGDLTEEEEALAYKHYVEEIGTDEFVSEIDKPEGGEGVLVGRNEGGNLTACVRFDGPRSDRVREVIFTGDIFVTPPRAIMDLEAYLRGVKKSEIEEKTRLFFDQADIGMISLGPDEFTTAVLSAK